MNTVSSLEIFQYMMVNMELADWLLQTEKVVLQTNSQEYKLQTAKSTNTP